MFCERLPSTAKHILISENPKAGATNRHALVENLRDLLIAKGYEVEVLTDIHQVVRRAEELHFQKKLRCVIPAGGDGTISLVASRLPSTCPITPLPLGTENLLSKYFSIEANVEKVAETVELGHVVHLDAGSANGRFFLIMATAGFDADVVERLHSNRSGHIHQVTYVKHILKAIRQYPYPEVRVTTDIHPKPLKCRWGFVFNFPCYAMGLPIAPDASGFDGKLDLCTFRGGNLWNGLLYVFGIIMRMHRGWRDVHTERARRIRLESDGLVPYQLDGDPGGHLPLELEVIPNRVRFVVPLAWIEDYEKHKETCVVPSNSVEPQVARQNES